MLADSVDSSVVFDSTRTDTSDSNIKHYSIWFYTFQRSIIPSNCDHMSAIQLIRREDGGNYVLTPEGKAFLGGIDEEIAVVSVAGVYRECPIPIK